MPDVPNWVKDRAQCNLDLTFKALFDIATRDIQEAHKVDAITKGKFTFDIQREDRTNVPTFTVRRSMNGSPLDKVLFEQGRNEIQISFTGGADPVTIRPQWDAENLRCDLLVGDRPHEPWEVSRIALERMFFQD